MLRSTTRGWASPDKGDRMDGFRVVLSVESVQKNPGESLPSLVGRIQLDGKDAGLLVTYHPGKSFGHNRMKAILPGYEYTKQKVRIELTGAFELDAAETVQVRQGGGSSSAGVATVFIDDKELGSIGGKKSEESTYDVPLEKGTHQVRWVLTGGWLGAGNLLDVKSASGKPLVVHHTPTQRDAARTPETRKEVEFAEAGKSK